MVNPKQKQTQKMAIVINFDVHSLLVVKISLLFEVIKIYYLCCLSFNDEHIFKTVSYTWIENILKM